MNELKSFECLSSVLATARAGTPLRAARMLARAPSSIYRAIERIEKDAGSPLFERTPAGWVPTGIGREVVALAERIEIEISDAEHKVLAAAHRFPPALRLSASDSFAHAYLAPVLADFARRTPGLTVELLIENEFADLVRRKADIAVRPDRFPGDQLIGRRAGRLAHALYCARPLVAMLGRPRTHADLASFPACRLSPRLSHFTAASWWDTVPASSRPVTRMIAGTETALAGMVAAGAGIGVLPCFVGDRLDGVVRLDAIAISEPVDIWLVTHSALRNDRGVKSLLRWLTEAIARDAPLFAGASLSPAASATRARGGARKA